MSTLRRNWIWAVVGLLAMPAFADAETGLRKITVAGKCTRTVTPDRSAIILTAEVRDDDLRTATRKATESYERTRDAVKKLQLKDVDLRTVEYQVGEVREWQNGKNVMKGYRARMGLRVATSQVDKLSEVIAIATREGLKDVGSLQSFLSESQELKEQVACLQEAAENARAKAEKLAAALGSKVGEALAVTESGGFQAAPQRMMMMEMDGLGGGAGAQPKSAGIEPGQQTLTLTVEVAFALK